jgi:peroxiredoxin
MTLTHKSIRYLLLAGVMLLALSSSEACGSGGKAAVQLGSQAPDFTLEAVREGSYHLQDLQGKVVLLSFLNSQAEASAMPEPSRSQIVFLKSMLEQYGSNEMIVLIVDAAYLRTGKQPTKDDLINFTYNWQLDTIPVLVDPKGAITRSYDVTDTPTTFLIGTDGLIQQRWDGSATAPQLAFAIEALVGAPAFRATSGTTPIMDVACSGETPSQAKFTGVGLARSLSNEIWVVDSGQAWGSGSAYPLQWIIIDKLNQAGDGQLILQVIGHYLDSNDRFELVNQQLQSLPTDEVQGLLVGEAGKLPNVYLLPFPLSLEKPGCLQVEAYVLREGSLIAIYSGQAIVAVK